MATRTRTQVIVGGDVKNSQIVIGNNNNVYVNQGNPRPKVERIPAPVLLGRPQRPIDLLDREEERNTVQKALTSGFAVEFYGAEGFGKTTLLSQLSSQLQLPDGLVYLSVNGLPLEDLLQELFAAFFQSDQVYIPSQVEYLRRFETIRALIVLDDISLTRAEIQTLLKDLPACVFIFSTLERHLWDQGNSLQLAGLPSSAALDLFQAKAGRSLSADEEQLVEKICAALQGNPLHIVQAAAAIRDGSKTIAALAGELQVQPVQKALFDGLLSAVPDAKKRVLALLASLPGASLPVDHIAKLSNVENLPSVLDGLLQQNLIQAHSPRYSVTDDFGLYLRGTWDLSDWKEAILRHFTDWTAKPPPQDQVLDAADALFAVLGIAAAEERWKELLQIGRAIEPAFVLSGTWGAWLRLLNLLSQAAEALGDRFAQGWVLHQMGSRLLSLGNPSEAGELLSRALAIRKSIGDGSGAAATRHNLAHLKVRPTSCTRWLFGCVGAVVVIAALITAVLAGGRFIFPATPTWSPTPTSTNTATVTPSDTPTDTPSVTPTLAPSITPTLTPSITPTFTPSITPTFTPNPPPPAPINVSPVQNTNLCYPGNVTLKWIAPYDANGLINYEVQLEAAYFSSSLKIWYWQTVIDQQVSAEITEYDATSEAIKSGSTGFQWRVRAQDKYGAWGDWSPWSYFTYETCVY